MADVFVGSRTHELRVFTGSREDAREYAAGLVEQLRDQGPGSRNPYVSTPWPWTPENWRDAKNESAANFRQGITSRGWYGPAGLEIRIEDAPTDCPRCEGSMVEPGTVVEGDWDSAAMRHHPYSGEPCTACDGTGKAPETTPDAPTGGED